jgi:F-type H+-transporting ATPase subunit a
MDKILRSFEPSSLENIAKVNRISFDLFGLQLKVNVTTLVMTWIVMGIILLVAWLCTRDIRRIPGRVQCLVETVIEFFDSLINDTIGESGRRYFPLIMTIFLFVLVSNWLAIIPPLKNPTSDLNTTLGLGVMVFIVAHSSAILTKGVLRYIYGFFEPVLIAPIALLINVFGEFGKTMSHSFRLFGNIFGGGLIILVVFEMPKYLEPVLCEFLVGKVIYFGLWPILKIVVPVGLNLFFGLFIGTIQAFVFTVLAIAYISVARG